MDWDPFPSKDDVYKARRKKPSRQWESSQARQATMSFFSVCSNQIILYRYKSTASVVRKLVETQEIANLACVHAFPRKLTAAFTTPGQSGVSNRASPSTLVTWPIRSAVQREDFLFETVGSWEANPRTLSDWAVRTWNCHGQVTNTILYSCIVSFLLFLLCRWNSRRGFADRPKARMPRLVSLRAPRLDRPCLKQSIGNVWINKKPPVLIGFQPETDCRKKWGKIQSFKRSCNTFSCYVYSQVQVKKWPDKHIKLAALGLASNQDRSFQHRKRWIGFDWLCCGN